MKEVLWDETDFVKHATSNEADNKQFVLFTLFDKVLQGLRRKFKPFFMEKIKQVATVRQQNTNYIESPLIQSIITELQQFKQAYFNMQFNSSMDLLSVLDSNIAVDSSCADYDYLSKYVLGFSENSITETINLDQQMLFAQLVNDYLEEHQMDRKHLNRKQFDAACSGNLEEVKLLISLGADINSQHTDKRIQSNSEIHVYKGKTHLFIAAEMGHHEVVQFLLDKGANPKIRDAGFWRPYDVALIMERQYGKKECSPDALALQKFS